VAGLMAKAGVEGAGLNVLINLGEITDGKFKSSHQQEVAALVAKAGTVNARVQQAVLKNIK
jgi:formiminotetrahydrofolate cyclodeaminase